MDTSDLAEKRGVDVTPMRDAVSTTADVTPIATHPQEANHPAGHHAENSDGSSMENNHATPVVKRSAHRGHPQQVVRLSGQSAASYQRHRRVVLDESTASSSSAGGGDLSMASSDVRVGASYRQVSGHHNTTQELFEAFAHRGEQIQQLKAENQQLLQKYKDRENAIVTHMTQNEEHYRSLTRELDGLKDRIRRQLVHPVSHEEYERIKKMPEGDKDVVQVIRECVFAHNGDITERFNEVSEQYKVADQIVKQLEAAVSKLQADAQDTKSVYDFTVGDLESRTKQYEQRVQRLEGMLHESQLRVEENATKVVQYDSVKRELEDKVRELRNNTEELTDYKLQAKRFSSDLSALKDESHKDRSSLHHTTTQVTYLTKENEQYENRVRELEAAVTRLQTSNDDLQKERHRALEQMHSDREAQRVHYEKQLQAETDRLTAGARDDLERVRTAGRELTERETRSLREARDAAISETSRLHREVDELRSRLELTLTEQKTKDEENSNTITELRATLKGKVAEGLRLELLVEEHEDVAARAKTHAECLERKLDILKNEFYELRLEHKQRVTELETTIRGMDEKLQMKADLDLEVETYINNIAMSAIDAKGLAEIPGSRRLQHTVTMTKRALQLENEVATLKRELRGKDADVKKLTGDLVFAKGLMGESAAPFQVVTDQLHAKDEVIEELTKALDSHRTENDVLTKRLGALQQELTVVSRHKSELLRVKEMIKSLRAASGSAGPVDTAMGALQIEGSRPHRTTVPRSHDYEPDVVTVAPPMTGFAHGAPAAEGMVHASDIMTAPHEWKNFREAEAIVF